MSFNVLCRWLGKRGDCFVFRRGKLLYRQSTGSYRVVLSGITLAQAEKYIASKKAKYRRDGGTTSEALHLSDKIRKLPRLPKPTKKSLAKNPKTYLTAEQQAEVEARIVAHTERVQLELKRIGEGKS